MKALELLLPRVLEKAAACPEPTALRYLRDAAIEFCRRTRIWRATVIVEIAEDSGDEAVEDVDEGASIFEITHASFAADECDARDLTPVTIDWLDAERPGWRDEEGTPVFLTQSTPDTVRLVPIPEDAGELTLQLILVPHQTADELPDVLIDTYPLNIADGALGKVLLLPAEFGNAQLGKDHARLFEEALGHFGARVSRGQQRAKRRTKPSSYF